ncbi:MAG TPA: hypothetical protein VE987_15815 [Polyangiaceae bacterium]|nr:hypothetical protein [Polyangiaceae bacterium]
MPAADFLAASRTPLDRASSPAAPFGWSVAGAARSASSKSAWTLIDSAGRAGVVLAAGALGAGDVDVAVVEAAGAGLGVGGEADDVVAPGGCAGAVVVAGDAGAVVAVVGVVAGAAAEGAPALAEDGASVVAVCGAAAGRLPPQPTPASAAAPQSAPAASAFHFDRPVRRGCITPLASRQKALHDFALE